MSKIDERLAATFRQAQRDVQPSATFEQLDRRRAARVRSRRFGSGALVVVVLAGTVGGTLLLGHVFRKAPPAPGQPAPGNGLIVTSLDDRWGAHLYLVDPADPTDPHDRPLTRTSGVPEQDTNPDVSPDGRIVAFTHKDLTTLEETIWIVGIDGTGLRRLTDPTGIAKEPVWSPDGTKVAFTGSLGGPYGIWVMNADGTNPHLVPGTDELAVAYPTWSPDGTEIAFQGSTADANNQPIAWDIFSVALGGGTVVDLTNTPDDSEVMPSWSPDGTTIAFANGPRGLVIDREVPFGGISAMNADGSDRRDLTAPGTFDQHPSWSPDGALITFERTGKDPERPDPESNDIYVMNADGTSIHRISMGSEPSWQPVGLSGDATAVPLSLETQVRPGATRMVVAFGSVWVVEPGAVLRVGELRGDVTAQIEVDHTDEFADITTGGGLIWVTTARGAVVGIDPSTNAIDRSFEVETVIHTVMYADEGLYVGHSAEGNGTLTEIDPMTGDIRRDIVTGGAGLAESNIIAAGGAYWVGYTTPDRQGNDAGLVRVSSDFSHVDTVAGISRVGSMAEAGGYVWAVGSGVLYQVSLDGTLVGTFDVPRAGKVASDGAHLWLLLNTGSTSNTIYLPDPSIPTRVVEVDTRTGAFVGAGVALPHDVPANLTAADGFVWVSFYDDGVATRLHI